MDIGGEGDVSAPGGPADTGGTGGFGTDDEKALEDSIVHALQSGYRMIDTAQMYQVEHVVGRAIRASGVPREEITVVTKFWSHWHHDPAAALAISLKELGLDYVDVFLMHWPQAKTPLPEAKTLLPGDSPSIVDTWLLMEKLVGPQCRTIGVSNFTERTLEQVLARATIVPAINEIELHALNPCHRLVPYCAAHGIQVISWSTLGGPAKPDKDGVAKNPVLDDALFTSIAAAHGVGSAIVSLSWAVQRGVAVIPKSASLKRIDANIRLVTLTAAEMDAVNNAHKTLGQMRLTDASVNLAVTVNGKRTVMGWTNADMGWTDEEGHWLT